MSPSLVPDSELITRVLLRDDRHAFATLVRTHQDTVRAFLRRLCHGDGAWADDLAQETFLKAWHNLASFRGQGRFSSWMCGIGYRLFLSDVRRKQLPTSDSLEEPSQASPADAVHLHNDLQRALSALSDGERAVMALCYSQQLSHEEAASALDLPLGTVKTHVSRGKEKLRARLQAYVTEVAHDGP